MLNPLEVKKKQNRRNSLWVYPQKVMNLKLKGYNYLQGTTQDQEEPKREDGREEIVSKSGKIVSVRMKHLRNPHKLLSSSEITRDALVNASGFTNKLA